MFDEGKNSTVVKHKDALWHLKEVFNEETIKDRVKYYYGEVEAKDVANRALARQQGFDLDGVIPAVLGEDVDKRISQYYNDYYAEKNITSPARYNSVSNETINLGDDEDSNDNKKQPGYSGTQFAISDSKWTEATQKVVDEANNLTGDEQLTVEDISDIGFTREGIRSVVKPNYFKFIQYILRKNISKIILDKFR